MILVGIMLVTWTLSWLQLWQQFMVEKQSIKAE